MMVTYVQQMLVILYPEQLLIIASTLTMAMPVQSMDAILFPEFSILRLIRMMGMLVQQTYVILQQVL